MRRRPLQWPALSGGCRSSLASSEVGSCFAPVRDRGGLALAFMHAQQKGASIAAFTLFSLFLTLASGTAFALIPCVNPHNTGSVRGVAGFLLLLRECTAASRSCQSALQLLLA